MTGQTPPFDFGQRRAIPHARLSAAASVDVTQSLRAFCEQATDASPDFDELMKVGLLLQENPTGCAETIVDWLAAEVTPLRVDVACALLFGLWNPSPRVAPPAVQVVARLAALRPSHRIEPDAEYSYALAMSRVAEARNSSPEATVLAHRELDLAAKRGTGDSGLDRSLFGLRGRLVPKAVFTISEFRAYASSGHGPALFVLERPSSHEHIAEVLELSEAGSTLTIRYRKLQPALSNIVVVDAIETALLTNFLEQEHRSRISSVEYVDDEAGFRVTAAYPK